MLYWLLELSTPVIQYHVVFVVEIVLDHGVGEPLTILIDNTNTLLDDNQNK